MNILYLSSAEPARKNGYAVESEMHRSIICEIGEKRGRTVCLFYCFTEMEEIPGRVLYVKTQTTGRKLAAAVMGYPPNLSLGVVSRTMHPIREFNIDVVYIDNSISGKLVKKIKGRFPHVRVICFFHDIQAVKMPNDKGSSLLRRMVLPVYLRNERLTVAYSDRTIVLNRRDADLYRQVYGKDPFMLAPVGLNMPGDVDGGLRHRGNTPLKLLFVGVVYEPNLNAIRWFLKHVVPQVRSNITFSIVGKDMEKYREEFEQTSDCVRVLGTIDSLAPHYIDADIVVVPLFEGGGMKIKTAEAFSYGKRYIGTTEGLEGYWEEIPEPLKGTKIFRCDDPADFARTIDHLAANDFFKFDPAVRQLAEDKYSFKRIYECYDRTFDFAGS